MRVVGDELLRKVNFFLPLESLVLASADTLLFYIITVISEGFLPSLTTNPSLDLRVPFRGIDICVTEKPE
jgi:hypothetical protein